MTKKLTFKKGMPVVWFSNYRRILLTKAEVTMVTTKDGQPIVYARSPDSWGGYNRRSFSPVAGMFQENPYPIWKLIPLEGRDFENMQKRAEKATKLFRGYEEAYTRISYEVEQEARQWQRDETARRTAQLSHGPSYMQRVISRLGFKKPRNGVKVKVNGKITRVS